MLQCTWRRYLVQDSCSSSGLLVGPRFHEEACFPPSFTIISGGTKLRLRFFFNTGVHLVTHSVHHGKFVRQRGAYHNLHPTFLLSERFLDRRVAFADAWMPLLLSRCIFYGRSRILCTFPAELLVGVGLGIPDNIAAAMAADVSVCSGSSSRHLSQLPRSYFFYV